MSDELFCYCGRKIEEWATGWRHVEGDPVWCYEEEAGLDEASRCNAAPEDEGTLRLRQRGRVG